MTYAGLGQYGRERPDPLAKRAGESDEAHQRRIAPFLRHAQDVEEQAWAQHRARLEQPVGQGAGLFGRSAPTERAQVAGTLGFAGEQQLAHLGHVGSAVCVPGSVTVPRVYVSEIEGHQQRPEQRTPAESLRSSGEGWFAR